MKSILTVIFVLLIGECAAAQHKAAAGIDLTGIIRSKSLNISASYGFTESWSASWMSSIDLSLLKDEESQEEEEHRSEFSHTQTEIQMTGSHSLTFQYWPGNVFTGTYMTAGIKRIGDGKTDCIVGAGYCIPVWKGLRMNISYETDIISSFQDKAPTGRGLHIGIQWTLETM
ncbi:MAG: hypothetical protein IKY66_06775 [Bacteroidales bacterium]|nr:hypothetical protein [Bacteroidales bacterium]